MNKRTTASIAITVFLVGTAWAHHSTRAVYDLAKIMTVTGTLTQIDWRNPHIYVWVDVRGETGQVERWLFEGPPPSTFRNRAIGRADFERSIGQLVTVEDSRARDGSLTGLIRQITLADGTVVPLCPQNC